MAGKALKMRTIWYRTMQEKEESLKKRNESTKKRRPRVNLDDDDEAQSQAAKEIDVEALLGDDTSRAGDYLAHTIAKEFADAQCETLEEVGKVIEEWSKAWEMEEKRRKEALDTSSEAVSPSSSSPAVQEVKADGDSSSTSSSSKFCIGCGTRIPVKARFCPACGEKQE